MTGCQTCGGYGNRHDPIAHDAEPFWPWEQPDYDDPSPSPAGTDTTRDDEEKP